MTWLTVDDHFCTDSVRTYHCLTMSTMAVTSYLKMVVWAFFTLKKITFRKQYRDMSTGLEKKNWIPAGLLDKQLVSFACCGQVLAYLTFFSHLVADALPRPLPIGQVRMKSYLRRRKIWMELFSSPVLINLVFSSTNWCAQQFKFW